MCLAELKLVKVKAASLKPKQKIPFQSTKTEIKLHTSWIGLFYHALEVEANCNMHNYVVSLKSHAYVSNLQTVQFGQFRV